jgi:hypothetical protein
MRDGARMPSGISRPFDRFRMIAPGGGNFRNVRKNLFKLVEAERFSTVSAQGIMPMDRDGVSIYF